VIHALLALVAGALSPAYADTVLPEVVVHGAADDELGVASSASEGKVEGDELKDRPVARPAEVTEAIPGMVVTQHSGAGKANQYYLRGFNLDHGTDFAFYVDGVPINLPTHAHGQGYSDLNWLIPELLQGVSYEKGVYYADQGDFANAGAADIRYVRALPENLALAQAGSFGYFRALAAGSPALGDGKLLYALEAGHYDGPWQVPMNSRKLNGLLKYSAGDGKKGYSLAAQAYDGIWLASEQIPERAILSGEVERFASLDPSTGGNTHRYSLYGEWHEQGESSATKVTAYLAQYNLDLFSNFTYFLDQANGDAIEQFDSRVYTGVRANHTLYGHLLGLETDNTFGLDFRQDWIETSLSNVHDRALLNRVRTDHSGVTNLAPYLQDRIQWLPWMRTVAGLRLDAFYFSNASDDPANSGNRAAGAVSPKLSLIFGPWDKTEYYVQGGLGFRTNDARGILSTVDPTTGGPVRQLPPLVYTRGAEVGVRSSALSGVSSTLAFWSLWSDSDTFFDGDVGATVDADRPGVRYGVEWTNAAHPWSWLTADVDFAYSWAWFTDGDPAGVGSDIPESVTSVFSAGFTAEHVPGLEGVFASLWWRYFGPRPLVEDASQKSSPSSVVNLNAGYAINKTWSVALEVLNLFDTAYNDNEYFYSARLKGEAPGPDAGGGYNDHMVHPGEPRSIRGTLVARF
jgi:outer membrane receptor protein involved in Fe transport